MLPQDTPETLPPLVEDQRRPGRKKAFIDGKVAYGNAGEFLLECLIHDIAATGAKISLKRNEFIPKHLYLIDVEGGVAHEAVVMWIKVRQTIPQFGLKFTDTHRLNCLSNPKLEFLKQFLAQNSRPLKGRASAERQPGQPRA